MALVETTASPTFLIPIQEYFNRTYFVHYDLFIFANKERAALDYMQRVLCRSQVKESMGCYDFCFNMGYINYYRLCFARAITYFERALAASNSGFETVLSLAWLGNAHSHLANYREAYNYFESAIAQSSKRFVYPRYRKLVSHRKDPYPPEEGYHCQYLMKYPEDPDILYEIGNIFFARRDFEEAFQYYELSSQLHKSDPAIYQGILCLLYMGKPAEAEDRLKAMVQGGTFFPFYHIALGNINRMKQKIALACEHYKSALGLNSYCVQAMMNLGTLYFDIGEYHTAIKIFRNALRQKPNDEITHSNLGSAFMKLGNTRKALKHLCIARFCIGPRAKRNESLVDYIDKMIVECRNTIGSYNGQEY